MGRKASSKSRRQLTEEEKIKVTENLNLVHTVLQRQLHIKPYMDCYDDYFQEGCIGLIYAVMRFDSSLGIAFSTYAIPNIKGVIQRYRRETYHILHVPRPLKESYYKMLELQSRGYSMEEISEKLEISSLKLLDITNAFSVASMDANVEDDNGSSMSMCNLIADWRNSYEDLIFEHSFMESLEYVLSLRKKELHRAICEEWCMLSCSVKI